MPVIGRISGAVDTVVAGDGGRLGVGVVVGLGVGDEGGTGTACRATSRARRQHTAAQQQARGCRHGRALRSAPDRTDPPE
jgi:hypothetical protein